MRSGGTRPQVYVVGAVRSAIGRRRGGLAGVHPADLGADVLRELVVRSGAPAERIDDVIWGCVGQVGPQASNIARTTVLSAGLPEAVPATTIDRQCGSSQQAVQFAAQAIRSGDQDVVVAGGVEVMSQVPIGSPTIIGVEAGLGHPREGAAYLARFGEQEMSQFRGAEMIAERWRVSREAMDQYAAESHAAALRAIAGGAFEAEILPLAGVVADEGPREDSTLARLAQLTPLRPGGTITAGLASQISDGAAALMLASEEAVARWDLQPLATVVDSVVVGSDPVEMLTGPIPATRSLLDRTGIDLDAIESFEVNEAFACVPLAWMQEFGLERERTNPDGGAIALGHPLGCSGARLMTTLIHRMHRDLQEYGLVTMCEGGGMGNATLLRRA